ncbi:MAG: GNAT family N-acetyltransferase [Candidatus Harrisonbacteria bacterium]|nr:GNAT family N-acetyltransferase [Candidatus Harrisonbacteria bacterium]
MIEIRLECARDRNADEIEELAKLVPSINRLLPQLSSVAVPVTLKDLIRIWHQGNFFTAFAIDNDLCAGMRAVGMASIFFQLKYTGLICRIEDVVVDEQCRGKGIAERLLSELFVVAGSRTARFVELTSRPERKAAQKLYKKLGFVKVKKNVFRKVL